VAVHPRNESETVFPAFPVAGTRPRGAEQRLRILWPIGTPRLALCHILAPSTFIHFPATLPARRFQRHACDHAYVSFSRSNLPTPQIPTLSHPGFASPYPPLALHSLLLRRLRPTSLFGGLLTASWDTHIYKRPP
jgi:hypothetical protein